MSWIDENRNFIRAAAWILVLVALLGPWTFDPIHVPAEYTCDKPFVRLEGDFCGYPMSGFQFFMYSGMALFLLPLIPLFSMPILIIRKNSYRLQMINLIAWGASAALSLIILVFQLQGQTLQLWGLALYTALAVTVFIFEVLVRIHKTAPP